MEKSRLIKVRKELHNLPGSDRGPLPLRVMGPTTNYWWDESTSCFIWDDDNEVLYIICPNTIQTSTSDSRLFPMSIITLDYEAITFIEAPVDRLSLDNFLKDKVNKGQTNEETRKRYFKDMTDLNDERTYFMGQPSPTTEKRTLQPDDEIINKDVQFL
jgi:hypothetical protein